MHAIQKNGAHPTYTTDGSTFKAVTEVADYLSRTDYVSINLQDMTGERLEIWLEESDFRTLLKSMQEAAKRLRRGARPRRQVTPTAPESSPVRE